MENVAGRSDGMFFLITCFKLVFRNKELHFGLLSSNLLPSPVLCLPRRSRDWISLLCYWYTFYHRSGDTITWRSSVGNQSLGSTGSAYLSCELISVYLTNNFNAKWLHFLYRANVGWDFVISCFFVKRIETKNEKFGTEYCSFLPKAPGLDLRRALPRALLVLQDFSLSPCAPRHITVFSYWTSCEFAS